MPRKRKAGTTAGIKTPSKPQDLPPCPGPKLHAFRHQNAEIEWLGRIDQDRDEMSGSGEREGYIFKVKIKSQLYALKVFKFFNPEDTRDYWGPLLKESVSPQTVAYHTDPFFAECRAYGRLKEAQAQGKLKKELVVPCRGYLLLKGDSRRILMDEGIDLEEDCLLDQPVSSNAPRIRALVKDLASQNSGVNKGNLRRILKDIKRLNEFEIYNRDVRKDNFRDGKLIDFGSAWTKPHCFLTGSIGAQEILDTRWADLVMFDEMVQLEGFKTTIRGMPSWKYLRKLRSYTESS